MISSLQLRAARSMLMLTLKDLHDLTGISVNTLAKMENKHPLKLTNVDLNKIRRLEQVYKIYGINFIEKNKTLFRESRLTKKLENFK